MVKLDRPRLNSRVLACVAHLITIFVIAGASFGASPLEPPQQTHVNPPALKPLVLYYSRTGTTRTIARELAKTLPSEIEEIISRKERHGIWAITCVFDQLFDRDDDIEPARKGLDIYNPLIIATPVWIHRISSPMRTFLKHTTLKGKDVFLVLTNNGNFDEKDEKEIREYISSYGFSTKGSYPVCTTGKDESALRNDAYMIMEDIVSLLNN